eukprot:284815430_5
MKVTVAPGLAVSLCYSWTVKSVKILRPCLKRLLVHQYLPSTSVPDMDILIRKAPAADEGFDKGPSSNFTEVAVNVPAHNPISLYIGTFGFLYYVANVIVSKAYISINVVFHSSRFCTTFCMIPPQNGIKPTIGETLSFKVSPLQHASGCTMSRRISWQISLKCMRSGKETPREEHKSETRAMLRISVRNFFGLTCHKQHGQRQTILSLYCIPTPFCGNLQSRTLILCLHQCVPLSCPALDIINPEIKMRRHDSCADIVPPQLRFSVAGTKRAVQNALAA